MGDRSLMSGAPVVRPVRAGKEPQVPALGPERAAGPAPAAVQARE